MLGQRALAPLRAQDLKLLLDRVNEVWLSGFSQGVGFVEGRSVIVAAALHFIHRTLVTDEKRRKASAPAPGFRVVGVATSIV